MGGKIDDFIAKIDECRREKDYYWADFGKIILNSYGIVVMHEASGSWWKYDPRAASAQMSACNRNCDKIRAEMSEAVE